RVIRVVEGPAFCDTFSASTVCRIAAGTPVQLCPVRAAVLPVPRKESLLRAILCTVRKRSTPRPYRKKSRNQRAYSSQKQTTRRIEHAAPRHLLPPRPLARCRTQLPSSKSPDRRRSLPPQWEPRR